MNRAPQLATGGNTGIGVQYAQVGPDAPDVSAAELLLNTQRANDAKLEEERLKRKPSRAAILESISKMEGTAGQKLAFQESVIGSLDEYDKRSKEDPNWVFSQEGIDKFSTLINDSVDPARRQQLAQNYKTIASGYDALTKAGGLDALQIANGRVVVQDSTDGSTKEIKIEDLDRSIHTPVTSRSRFEQVTNKKDYNPITDNFYAGLTSLDNAKKVLVSGFDDATGVWQGQNTKVINGMPVVMDIMGNGSALKAAKQQALNSMSDEVRSSLQSDYIQRIGNSKPTEKGFQAYVNSVLDQEIEKRRKGSEQLSGDGIRLMAEARKAADANQITEPQPTIYTTNRRVTAIDTEGDLSLTGNDSGVDILVSADSAIPIDPEKQIIPSLAVTGSVWAIGGAGRNNNNTNFSASKASDGSYGQAKNISKTFENLKHLSNSTVPVTVGPIFNPNGLPMKDKVGAGRIIIQNEDEDYEYGSDSPIPYGAEVEEITVYDQNSAGRTVKAIKRKDGNYMEVKDTAVKVYQGLNEDKEFTMFVPMNREESLRTLGINYSKDRSNINFFSSGGFSTDPSSQGQQLLDLVESRSPQLYAAIQQAYMEAANANNGKVTGDDQVRINKMLNFAKDRIEDGTIRNTFRYPKEEFTKKNSSDFVR